MSTEFIGIRFISFSISRGSVCIRSKKFLCQILLKPTYEDPPSVSSEEIEKYCPRLEVPVSSEELISPVQIDNRKDIEFLHDPEDVGVGTTQRSKESRVSHFNLSIVYVNPIKIFCTFLIFYFRRSSLKKKEVEPSSTKSSKKCSSKRCRSISWLVQARKMLDQASLNRTLSSILFIFLESPMEKR